MSKEEHLGRRDAHEPFEEPWNTSRRPRVRIDISTFYRAKPRDLLTRFLEGDPLDMELRCFRRRSQLAYLISSVRLVWRAAARAAYAGYSYRGDPPVDTWLEGRIDHSIRELLEEDEVGARKEQEVERPEDYEFVARALDVSPADARSACVAFNALDPDVRTTFFAVSVARTPIEDHAGHQGRDLVEVKTELGTALATLLLAGGVHNEPAELAGSLLRNWPEDW